MSYSIAVQSTDITPTAGSPGCFMAGYGWAKRINTGQVARKLRAQCAVIRDSGAPNILVRIDALGLPAPVHDNIRNQVVAEGLVGSSSDFLISCSHTHSGSALGDHPDVEIVYDLSDAERAEVDTYATTFVNQIMTLIRQTVAAPSTPVNLSYTNASVSISVNRVGLPWNPTDTPILLARSVADNTPVAVFFGHACHAVARGDDPVFDSDYPGMASQLIEGTFNCPALFFQGTCGDLNPDNMGSDAAVVDVGTRLANTVIKAVQGGGFTAVSGPIVTQLATTTLPFFVDPTDQTVAARLIGKYQARVAALAPSNDPTNQAAVRHANKMLDALNGHTVTSGIPEFVQCWKFGTSLTLIGISNEPLSGWHIGLHQLYKTAPLWVMGYINTVATYCPGDDVLWHRAPAGFYESGWDTDPEIVGVGSSTMAFGWPSSLRSTQPPGTTPAAANSVEGMTMATCRSQLGV